MSHLNPPADWIGPVQSCGRWRNVPCWPISGYAGADWQQHWQDLRRGGVDPPFGNATAPGSGFQVSARPSETAFAALVDGFGLQFPRAHSTWGLLTRIGAKIAAYNVGILVNRHFDRPDLAFATLVV